MNFSNYKELSKLFALVISLLFFSSCVETTSQINATEEVLSLQAQQQKRVTDLQAQQKKLIAEQQARIKALQSGNTKTAALVTPVKPAPKPKTKRKVTKAAANIRPSNNITQRASLRCVPKKLRSVIYQVARKFGHVTVNSTGRSRRHNRRVGGARQSYHIGCRAVDFRVNGKSRGLYRYLRNHPYVGGLKRYRSGFYHIDNGPRRSW